MPWTESDAMDQRRQFVTDALSDRFTMNELCARYGVSRRICSRGAGSCGIAAAVVNASTPGSCRSRPVRLTTYGPPTSRAVPHRERRVLLPADHRRPAHTLPARVPRAALDRDGHARPVFERVFREYGLPRAIRTDNGVPFATLAVHGLSYCPYTVLLPISPAAQRYHS